MNSNNWYFYLLQWLWVHKVSGQKRSVMPNKNTNINIFVFMAFIFYSQSFARFLFVFIFLAEGDSWKFL